MKKIIVILLCLPIIILENRQHFKQELVDNFLLKLVSVTGETKNKNNNLNQKNKKN